MLFRYLEKGKVYSDIDGIYFTPIKEIICTENGILYECEILPESQNNYARYKLHKGERTIHKLNIEADRFVDEFALATSRKAMEFFYQKSLEEVFPRPEVGN